MHSGAEASIRQRGGEDVCAEGQGRHARKASITRSILRAHGHIWPLGRRSLALGCLLDCGLGHGCLQGGPEFLERLWGCLQCRCGLYAGLGIEGREEFSHLVRARAESFFFSF